MKVGDLVRTTYMRHPVIGIDPEVLGSGIIIMKDGLRVVVFWSEQYPQEVEYTFNLEVINESR